MTRQVPTLWIDGVGRLYGSDWWMWLELVESPPYIWLESLRPEVEESYPPGTRFQALGGRHHSRGYPRVKLNKGNYNEPRDKWV